MKKVFCIFCREEKEKSKEHIWPRWLQIEIGGSTKGIHVGTHFQMINPYNHNTRKQSGESLVYGGVCKDCNNGWMSSLEAEFKPTLINLLADKHNILHVSKTERQVISLWSFKTALIINAGSNYRKIVPESHFSHLFNNKTLIKNLKVDFGYIDSKKQLLWRQSPIGLGLMRNSEQDNFHNLLSSSYRISMQLKSIGIRVSYFPTAKESGYENDFSEKDKTIRIWPFMKNSSFNPSNSFEDIDSFDLDCIIKPAHNRRS